ncbi:N-acetylmuramoyl-L-alanine amidase [Amycolatopsis acidiphila]|uniref:N-acetylmuramoyl-L-alanine amidase n=1 Tax=Amycolatopsis acidiphila TaxID=715473 RepID=A0A557ZR05_9PSEU|nr:peptidoglycan recognition family protein [Amycolatopsis acidiphila]TVT14453.1 N-acetylmuramoyl-L-alanine amidase [Amycolatopsis acidiphila]UIJ60751.1 N-acetylmuramoyl-L-alanine amidase [Amycolatopsis acidiphila]GHG91038.1 amidase [Amycolatopsis acidiphila]
MDPFTRRTALRVAAAGTAGLAVTVPGIAGASVAADQARQRAFAAAAAEFGVPEQVLLGVSYLKSRWDYNAGTPSTGAGFGPMHLTDLRAVAAGGSHHDKGSEDPRGDLARATLHPAEPQQAAPAPTLQTVDLAAELTGANPAALRTDPTQNIRGGAAVLAQYQRELGITSDNPADWYGAVARYSGATDSTAAAFFADEVFGTITGGAGRVTDDGQSVRLDAQQVSPARGQLRSLGLPAAARGDVEAPPDVSAEWIPAPYQQTGDGAGDYGNYDKAERPQSQQVTHIVIHDTECSYDAALALVQDPTYLGWHYTLRSSDGHIAQHIQTKDVGWHAGNWYVNAKSIGVEHEGFGAQGTWYTEAMYRTSAKLVRYLADRYGIPLDRRHIIGHDNVPGTIPSTVAGMHWDPGPYWDWGHYFDLLGAPLRSWARQNTGLVMIKPDFATNRPGFTDCDTAGAACTLRGSSAVILHTEPRDDAPLLQDLGLHPDGSPSTMGVSDVGSRASTGQQYAVAEVRGDWTAIWYLGQKGWFRSSAAVPALGQVVTPKPGLATVPVYGRAYPEAEAYPANIPPQDLTPLQYTFAAGQKYVAGPVLPGEYYWATTFDPSTHVVVRGKTEYVQIQFGHRVAYVKADDVVVGRP